MSNDITALSAAALTRVSAREADLPVASSAAAAQPVGASPPTQAAFFSPVYRFDSEARLAILTFRDVTTGIVTAQVPGERVVEEYRRAAHARTAENDGGSAGSDSRNAATGNQTTRPVAQVDRGGASDRPTERRADAPAAGVKPATGAAAAAVATPGSTAITGTTGSGVDAPIAKPASLTVLA
ncbi:MAG: hypothetical protein GC191_21340 [Azospirillum sp.]|nr:hypothetical protein [Azospirillum sp.]